jgi:hypothetical protein
MRSDSVTLHTSFFDEIGGIDFVSLSMLNGLALTPFFMIGLALTPGVFLGACTNPLFDYGACTLPPFQNLVSYTSTKKRKNITITEGTLLRI